MSLNKEAYIRYKIIDECISNKFRPYPSIEDIIENCLDKLGKKFSVSAIQKDIKAMKEDELLGFLAPISYSRIHNGYYYKDPNYSINKVPLNSSELESLEAVSDVLNMFSGSRISNDFDHAVKKIFASISEKRNEFEKTNRIIQTDSHINHKGFENFELLYHSISNKIPICFVHYSYSKRCYRSNIVHPYLIKEFQNKWYVLGFSETHNEFRTFGLDRIYEPILLKKEYIPADSEFINTFYDDMYGVYPIPDESKQKILINVKSLLSEYLKANPIHSTQEIVDIKENGNTIFQFNIIPTVELINFFTQYCAHIRVLEPDFIINIIKKSIKNSSY